MMAVVPSLTERRASASETSTRRRSISGCSGPLPDLVRMRTLIPCSASCSATADPTGPAPVTISRFDMVCSFSFQVN